MTVCGCLLYAAIVYCYQVFAGGWFDFRFEEVFEGSCQEGVTEC